MPNCPHKDGRRRSRGTPRATRQYVTPEPRAVVRPQPNRATEPTASEEAPRVRTAFVRIRRYGLSRPTRC